MKVNSHADFDPSSEYDSFAAHYRDVWGSDGGFAAHLAAVEAELPENARIDAVQMDGTDREISIAFECEFSGLFNPGSGGYPDE